MKNIFLVLLLGLSFLSFEYQEGKDFATVFENYQLRIAQYEKNYPDSALIFVHKVLALKEIDTYPQKKIKAIFQKSKFEFLTNEYNLSVLTAEEADSLLRFHPNDELKKEVLYRLAEGYEYTTRQAQAMKAYEACFQLAEKTNDYLTQVRLNLKLGDIYNANQEPVYALEKYLLAAQKAENIKVEHPHFYFLSWYEYFQVYSKNPLNYPQEKILEKCTQLQNYIKELEAYPLAELKDKYQDLGKRCLLQENNLAGINKISLETIEAIQSKSSNSSYHFRKYLLNGEIALIQNKLDLAEAYFQKAHQVAEKSNNFHMRILILDLEKKLYELKGDFKKAIDRYKSSERYQLRLTENNRLEHFSQLEDRVRDLEKTKQAELLQKDKELLSARNRSYLLALAFLIVLAGLLFYLNRKTGQKNQIIEKQNEVLAIQKSELQQLNATKDKIFSIIGHDLRKPGLAFRGISKKIDYLLEAKDYKTLTALGHQLDHSSKSLDGLLNNLLHWSLTQKESIQLNPISLNFSAALDETLSIFEEKIKDKKLSIQKEIPTSLMVNMDPQALKSILLNLIDNAIKFSKPGDLIRISAKPNSTPGSWYFMIKDQGVGMNEKQLKNLFELSQNKSTEGTQGEKGTGLGLHLVKEFVELSKGTIQVQSQANKGTSFELSFS